MADARIVLTAVDKTSAAFASAQKGLSGIGSAAASVRGALSGIGAAGFIYSLQNMVRQTAEAGAQIQRLSTLSNVGAESFQEYAYAANRFGISQEKLADIFKDTQDKVGDFLQNGGGPLKDFFDNIAPQVGVTAEQFRRLSGPDALQLYVSSLQKANLSQSELTFYMEAIASDSAMLLPLLKDNGKAFNDLAKEARDLGVVMDEEAVKSAKAFNDELSKLSAAATGFGYTVGVPIITELNAIIQKFRDAKEEGRSFWNVAFLTPAQMQEKNRKNGAFGLVPSEGGGSGAWGDLRRGMDDPRIVKADPAAPPGKPPKPPRSAGAPRAAAPFAGATYDEQITQRVGKLFEDSDITKAKEYTDTLAKLDDLYYAGAISGELYDSALKKLTGSTAQTGEASTELADQQARLAQLLSGTASAALEGQRQDMALLTAALEKGIITEGLYLEAVTERLKLGAEASPVPPNASADFAGELRDDVKNALSNAFRDSNNPVQAFGDALGNIVFTRLSTSVAEALATAAFGNGSAGSTGFLTTALNLLTFDGGGYTGSGSRSGGMDGKGGFMAMLHPNETVVDHTKGQSTSSQSVVVNINNVVGDVASQSVVIDGMRTVRAQIMGELSRSMRYGGAAA